MNSRRVVLATITVTLFCLIAAPAEPQTPPYGPPGPLNPDPDPRAHVDCTAFPDNLISNCSFENGFTGWTVNETGFKLFSTAIRPTTFGLWFNRVTPTEGGSAAVTPWDGTPGFTRIMQDVDLTSGDCELQFTYRAGWDLRLFGATQPRVFDIRVEQPVGNNIFSQTAVTALPNTVQFDTGLQEPFVVIPVGSGPGRLIFDWTTPELFTGPSDFQIDNVLLECGFCPEDPVPNSQGYWHRQCLGVPAAEGGIDPGRNGRGPDSPAEPDFVSELMDCGDDRLQELGFFSEQTCTGMNAVPADSSCEKALKQLTATILNVCSERLGDACEVDAAVEGCSSTDLGSLIEEMRNLIASGNPTSCQTAQACANAINQGTGVVGFGGSSSVPIFERPVLKNDRGRVRSKTSRQR